MDRDAIEKSLLFAMVVLAHDDIAQVGVVRSMESGVQDAMRNSGGGREELTLPDIRSSITLSPISRKNLMVTKVTTGI